MSDLPPSTQPAQGPPLFHQLDGQRIQVFVEAGGIFNRPRLIRNLKKHDAVICSDPKNSRVILVNEDSWQGKEFIREWGKDQNKVVLSYTWVARCISVGKPLLAEDNWGGCLTHDDGLPIMRPTSVDDGGEAMSHSLPTPRETPAEIAPVSAPQKRKTLDRVASHLPPPINTAPPAVTEMSGVKSPTPRILPQTQNVQQPQPHSQLQPAPVLSPSVTDPMSMFSQQQSPSMPFPLPNGAMPPYNMPMSMMSFPPQMLAMLAQQATGASSPIASQPPPMMPHMQENFNTALMDIMKMYGAVPGSMSMNPWSAIPGSIHPQSYLQPTGGSSGSGTTGRDGSSVASGSRRDTESPNLLVPFPPPRSPQLSVSTKRKRKVEPDYDSSGESEVESDESERDEPSLSSLARKKKKMEQREKRKEKEQRRGSKSGLQYTAPTRNPHESPSQGLRVSSSDKVFVAADGKPMQFFVQVDLKGRLEVLRAIKKHSGALTSEIKTADYAVLSSLSSTFKKLLTDATAYGTPAVTSYFVLDASNQGGIPDNLKDYLFDAKQNITRKRKVSQKKPEDPVKAEQQRLAKNAKQAERDAVRRAAENVYVARLGTPEDPLLPSPGPSSRLNEATSTTPSPISAKNVLEKGKEKGKPQPGVKKPAVGAATSGLVKKPLSKKAKEKATYFPRDKTPPLPTQIEKGPMGYIYNREEQDFAEHYLLVLFKRDPEMSQTAVSKALHRKLPHHSVGSWAGFLNTKFRAQHEDARKKGGIAHRKEKSRWEEEQQKRLDNQRRDEESVEEKGEKERGWLAEGVRDVERKPVGEAEPNAPFRAPMEVDEPTLTKSATTEVQEEAHGPKLTQDEEDDLETVLQFFLNGGDDGTEPEDVVWAKLEQQPRPKSAASWAAFYDKHSEVVADRYEKSLLEVDESIMP